MATKPEKILIRQIQMRRDTPEQWSLHNPILADGEFGVERTPGDPDSTPSQFKIGDGVSTWTQLMYAGLIGPKGIDGKDGVYAISPAAGNRAVMDASNGDALFVSELQVDLDDILSRTIVGEEVDTSSYAISEKTLADFAVATGINTKLINDEIEKVAQLKKIAGQELSALTCVYEKDGVVYKLDYRDDDNIDYFLGITTTSAAMGSTINVQRVGQLKDDFWDFTLDRVYVGANGTVTQTPPEDGYDLLVGMATNSKTLVLNIQDPIELDS